MFADSDGDLWFFLNPGYSRGLFRLNPKSKEWKHYTTETSVALSSIMVRDVAEDMNGNIWIATDHGGINILDKRLNRMRYIRNNPFNQTSLSQNSVICLYRMIRGLCGPALIKTASTIIMRAFLNSRLSGTLWS